MTRAANTKTRTFFRRLRWLGLGLVILVLGVYLLRIPLFGSTIVSELETALGESLGGDYAIESVGGNFFTEFHINGLKTTEAGDPVKKLEIAKVEVSYSPLSYFTSGPEDILKRVFIRGLKVEYEDDLTAPKDEPTPEDETSEPINLSEILSSFPKSIPQIDIEGELTLRVLSEVDGAYTLAVKGGGDVLNIDLANGERPGPSRNALSFVVRRLTTQSWTADLSGQVLEVEIRDSKLALEGSGEHAASLILGVAGGEIEANVTRDLARLSVKGLALPNIPSIARRAWLEKLKTMPRSGFVDAQIDVQFSEETAAGNLTVTNLGWQDLNEAKIVAQVRGTRTKVRLEEISLVEQENRIQFLNVDLDLEAPTILQSMGKGEIELRKLDRFFSLVDDETVREKIPRGLSLIGGIQSVSENRITIEELRLSNSELALQIGGVVDLAKGQAQWQDGGADLLLKGQIFNLQKLAQDLMPDELAVPSVVRFTASVNKPEKSDLNATKVQFHLETDGAGFADVTLKSLGLDGVFEENSLRLNRIVGSTSHSDLSGRAQAQLRDGTLNSWNANLNLQCRDLAEFSSLDPALKTLAGSLTLDVEASSALAQKLDAIRGRVQLQGQDILYDGQKVTRLKLSVERPTAAPAQIKVDEFLSPDGDIVLAATVDPSSERIKAQVDRLEVRSPKLNVKLDEPFQVTANLGKNVIWDEMTLSAFGGKMSVAGSWEQSGTVDLDMTLSNIDSHSLHPNLKGPIKRGRVVLAGDINDLDWSLDAEASELFFKGRPLTVRLDAHRMGQAVFVKQLKLQAAEGDIRAQGHLPLTFGANGAFWHGPWSKSFTAQITAKETNVLAGLGAPSEFSHTDLGLNFKKNETGMNFESSVSSCAWQVPDGPNVEIGDLRVDSQFQDGSLQLNLKGGELVDLSANAELARAIRELSGSFPLDETVLEKFDWKKISGALRFDLHELKRLEAISDAVTSFEGKAHAQLKWGSLASTADLEGQLLLDELKVRTDGLARIDLDDTKFSIFQNTLKVEKFDAYLGYAPLSIGGSLEWADETLVSNLQIKGENCLVARDQFTRVRSDFDVALTGAIDRLLIKGDVKITSASYAKPIRFLDRSFSVPVRPTQIFSIRDSLLSNAKFDLNVIADDSVIIANNVAFGRMSADVHLGGTGEYPKPAGRIYTKDFRLNLPFSSLTVSTGEATFDETTFLTPSLNVAAETRMRGYDLNVQVRGTSAAPSVTVVSNPPLPRDDAVILLMTGATPSQISDEGLANATISRTGKLLGASILESLSDPSDPEKEGFADRFTLEVGRDVSPSGQATIETELRLSKHFYLRLERDRFDAYNLGGIWRVTFK